MTPIQKADQTVILLEIRGIFYSMCKIVMWVEHVEKWQLLEINKLCLKLAFVLSSVVLTCPTAKLWMYEQFLNALQIKCSSWNGVVSLNIRGIRKSLGKVFLNMWNGAFVKLPLPLFWKPPQHQRLNVNSLLHSLCLFFLSFIERY